MRTPGHDEELAAGFLFAEGIVSSPREIRAIEPCLREQGHAVNVLLAPEVVVDFARLERHAPATASCGICGRASIEAVLRRCRPIEADLSVTADLLLALPARLASDQVAFGRTGGLHAAGVFDAGGAPVVVREDVGRHNAVDKVLGFGLLAGLLPFDRHVLLVSGRASFEIVAKALAASVPVVAAVSAPSSLAVDLARACDQTLVGFLRAGGLNVYSAPRRVAPPPVAPGAPAPP
jgi:FdhD protein